MSDKETEKYTDKEKEKPNAILMAEGLKEIESQKEKKKNDKDKNTSG